MYYPPTEYAQPQADPYFIHPNSMAVQLGLTPEEVREVNEEQERCLERNTSRSWKGTEPG